MRIPQLREAARRRWLPLCPDRLQGAGERLMPELGERGANSQVVLAHELPFDAKAVEGKMGAAVLLERGTGRRHADIQAMHSRPRAPTPAVTLSWPRRSQSSG